MALAKILFSALVLYSVEFQAAASCHDSASQPNKSQLGSEV